LAVPQPVVMPIHFLPTVVAMVISFHLPGLKAHRLNESMTAALSVAAPVYFITLMRLTRPVTKLISSRYSPFPSRFRVQAPGSAIPCDPYGYCGRGA
jgi:hypothetical protein